MSCHNDLVLDVRNVGESLIKNAESIVGDEKYLTDLFITITFSKSGDALPTITINREFLPEKIVVKEK